MSYPAQPPAEAPRRVARWQRYLIKRPFSSKDLGGLVGLLVGVTVLALFLGWALDMAGGKVIVLALPAIFFWFDARRAAFRFDPNGLMIGGVDGLTVRWSEVAQIVVAVPADPAVTLIGVRLRQGAVLPAEVARVPQDPAIDATYHVSVPREKCDVQALVAKAGKYAPRHVQVVVADGAGERVVA